MKTIWWAHSPDVIHEKWARRDFSICDAMNGGWQNHGHIATDETGGRVVTCLACIAARAAHDEGAMD